MQITFSEIKKVQYSSGSHTDFYTWQFVNPNPHWKEAFLVSRIFSMNWVETETYLDIRVFFALAMAVSIKKQCRSGFQLSESWVEKCPLWRLFLVSHSTLSWKYNIVNFEVLPWCPFYFSLNDQSRGDGAPDINLLTNSWGEEPGHFFKVFNRLKAGRKYRNGHSKRFGLVVWPTTTATRSTASVFGLRVLTSKLSTSAPNTEHFKTDFNIKIKGLHVTPAQWLQIQRL